MSRFAINPGKAIDPRGMFWERHPPRFYRARHNKMNDRRVIGNTDHDAMMGRLIEKTSKIEQQASSMESTLKAFDRSLNKFNETIIKMQGLVDRVTRDHERHLSDSKEHDREYSVRNEAVNRRLESVEGWKEDVRFVAAIRNQMNRTIAWIIVAGIFLIAASMMFGGTFLHLVK